MTDVRALDHSLVEYPTSDGRPVAETPLHYTRLAGLAHALTMFFRTRADAYVGVNMLVYHEPGNPRRHLSPDIFVAFGAPPREREIYKLWEEPSPAFVLEVTSRTTRREDERKKRRYAAWGVSEYVLYDPRAEYLEPPLQGFELDGGSYWPMHAGILANGERGLLSNQLGIGLWLDDGVLRCHDPATGRNLLTPEEAEQWARDAEARARDAETKLAELKKR